MPSKEDNMQALEAVHDPHVPVSLRRMGMLRIHDAVITLPGVTDVIVEEGWHLQWSRDMIEPEVQDMMRVNGIQV